MSFNVAWEWPENEGNLIGPTSCLGDDILGVDILGVDILRLTLQKLLASINASGNKIHFHLGTKLTSIMVNYFQEGVKVDS